MVNVKEILLQKCLYILASLSFEGNVGDQFKPELFQLPDTDISPEHLILTREPHWCNLLSDRSRANIQPFVSGDTCELCQFRGAKLSAIQEFIMSGRESLLCVIPTVAAQ
ncbi:hypothetical protein CgunFtcFv8_011445 [Champsocephalus gunnari]|uniref:Uncharacterized protein n=1 Tax=Champsocephalus gunnari TaxID=52237 RepID=A0AAN8D5N9_CHAGU|nr:hypothetical protein CgunFtcFv8_011445 [Champsocephalus gunnari]